MDICLRLFGPNYRYKCFRKVFTDTSVISLPLHSAKFSQCSCARLLLSTWINLASPQFEGMHASGGVCSATPSPTLLLLLSYLPAHLGSNSGPLPRTHGQLRSIRRRNSRFHRSDRPNPWHKHEQLHSHSEVTILSQVGRRQTLIIIFILFIFYTVSVCLRKPVFFNSVEIFVCFLFSLPILKGACNETLTFFIWSLFWFG